MSKNAENIKRLRVEAAARGDCYTCRCRPAKPGSRNCGECLARGYAAKKARYRTNPKRGLCALCSRPRLRGITLCERHRDQACVRSAERYHALVAEGRCGRCGVADGSGLAHCRDCLIVLRAKMLKVIAPRRARGLCECGRKPKAGLLHCQRCLTKQAEASARYQQRKREAARCCAS